MLPAEVWTLIFSYLTNNNDLIEVSALSKTFYYLCRRNVRFVEKLSHSRTQFSGVVIFDYYKDICLSFAGQLSYALKNYFEENVFLPQKNLLWLNLFSTSFLFVCSIICFATLEAITPFLFYKNSFYKNHEAENRPEIKNFVRITPDSRSRDL